MNAKKLSKRIIASVITLMLALSCFVLPSVLVNAAESTTINIHYLRKDGGYDDWDVWAWSDGLEGSGYAFTNNGDENGAVCSITLTEATPRLGFIIRRPSDWKKDPDGNRSVELTGVKSGIVEVYCVSGSALDDYTVNYDKAELVLRVKEAVAESKTNVAIKFTAAPKDDDNITAADFTIKSASGAEVAIASYTRVSDTNAALELSEPLDYSKSYTITFRDADLKITLPDYFSSKEFEDEFTYTGDDLGVTINGDNDASFRVWAPTAEKVELNFYNEGVGGTAEVVQMDKDVNGTWVARVTSLESGNVVGKYYTYTAFFGSTVNKDIVDPYARTTGVNGKRGMVLALETTNPDGWDSDKRHTYKNITDMEIYELHVRDFSVAENSGITNKGKYLAFTETGTTTPDGIATGIDHLKDLGITSVHLLPVYDYGSVDETKLDKAQFNWGYDPVNYNTPEGSYSTDPYHGEVRVSEFKQMVQALHNAGIGVIMDVVYNHTYNTQYCFNQLVPDYFYRPGQNTSGCGNDVASERAMVSKFIVDSVKYWAEEYHLDGFRFDLMGILDVDTMNAVRAAVDEVDPTIIIYGEGWDMSSKPTKDVKMANFTNAAETPGIAYFSDTIRDAIKGSVFNGLDRGFVNGAIKNAKTILNTVKYTNKWSPSPSQIINYADCHDNLTLWDKIRTSNNADSEEDQIRQNNLAALIVQTAQGVPFMMSGEEFLRSKPLLDKNGNQVYVAEGETDTKYYGSAEKPFVNNTGAPIPVYQHNSYASPDSVNELDYSRVGTYQDVYNYYKGLIAFRKAHPALRMATAEAVEARLTDYATNNKTGVVAYTLDGGVDGEAAEKLLVIYNANTEAQTLELSEGEWTVYVNDQKAGTTALATVSGSVEVPRISGMILTQGYVEPVVDTYSIIGSMTDWKDDIEMTAIEGGYEGKFTVEPGTYEFKVRANHAWDDSWGVYEADYDRTYNSQTNVKVKVEHKTTFSVILHTEGDDVEDWFITYTYRGGGDDSDTPDTIYVNTGKGGNYTPPSEDETSTDTSTDTSKDTSTVKPDDGNVPTGDSTNVMIILVILLASGICFAGIYGSRKSKKSE